MWCCMWGRGREGTMALALLCAVFQSLPPLPTSKVHPSGADSCVFGFVYVLGPCGSLQWPLLWGWEFLPLPPQPPRVFSVRGLRLYFPVGALGCASCSFAHPAPQSTTSLGLAAATLLWALFIPPTGLDACFFFNSLVVGLPYSLIFCQFWLCFVFKLLLSFFRLSEEAQCVYLCLGRKSFFFFF